MAAKTVLIHPNVRHSRLMPDGKWQTFEPREAPYRVPVGVAREMVERAVASLAAGVELPPE